MLINIYCLFCLQHLQVQITGIPQQKQNGRARGKEVLIVSQVDEILRIINLNSQLNILKDITFLDVGTGNGMVPNCFHA